MNKINQFIVGHWYLIKVNNLFYKGLCSEVKKNCLFLKVSEFDPYFDTRNYITYQFSINVISEIEDLGDTHKYLKRG